MMHDRAALISEIRHFNRFYTRTIGLLEETLNASPFTLTEARVLFELGHRSSPATAVHAGWGEFLTRAFHLEIGPAASEIATHLRLDPAYLARILRKFADAGLTEARTDPADRRRQILSLTEKGSEAFAKLQEATNRDMGRLVGDLSDEERGELAKSLRKVRELLGEPAPDVPVVIRPHRPGDIGWVISRQARLYVEEYGWDGTYEALAAEICANFIRDFREGREFCWIAELGGEPVGAVFLVYQSDDVGKLRLLHVEPSARGHGIGSKLVATCIEAARAAGYKKLVLWTNDVLVSARKIYLVTGFTLVKEERHHSFGKDLVGQNWELDL